MVVPQVILDLVTIQQHTLNETLSKIETTLNENTSKINTLLNETINIQ